jgi:hypothetical protein
MTIRGFQQVSNIGDKPVISILEDNIKSLLDYCFLKIGGFIDISIPSSGIAGGDFSLLKVGSDPIRPTGTVWETHRKDWVYETGISHNNRTPIDISGIYVNNSFYPAPTGQGNVAYSLNYKDGQVVFPTPKPASSNIRMNYSYRYIQTHKANESPWFKEIQKYSYDPSKINKNSGFLIMANHRVQLPCIIIETIARTSQQPYQLGTIENIISQDLLLHIYTENPVQRNSIMDMLILQKDRESYLYDLNKVIKDNKYGLNYNGSINNSGLNYDQLLSDPNYRKNVFYIESSSISEINTISSSLYNGIIRWTLKIYP